MKQFFIIFFAVIIALVMFSNYQEAKAERELNQIYWNNR